MLETGIREEISKAFTTRSSSTSISRFRHLRWRAKKDPTPERLAAQSAPVTGRGQDQCRSYQEARVQRGRRKVMRSASTRQEILRNVIQNELIDHQTGYYSAYIASAISCYRSGLGW